MTIPTMNTAKLVRVKDPFNPNFRIQEVADRLKFVEPTPVVILAGAMTQRVGKTMGGVARAA